MPTISAARRNIMKSKSNHERGSDTPAHERGAVIPADFYRPDTAAPFLALEPRFAAGDVPGWLADLHRDAAATVARMGLPTANLERWKYSNMLPLLKGLPKDMGVADIAVRDPEGYAQALPDVLKNAPDDVAAWLAAVPGDERYGDMMLWHLANAFLRDGVFVDVPAGKAVDKAVEITVTGQAGLFTCPRTVVRLGAGAEMTLVEYHRGAGHFWSNGVVQVALGEGAVLRHYRIQDTDIAAVHTTAAHVTTAEGARYESVVLTSGAGFSRHQAHAELQGRGAHVTLNTVNLLRGGQVGDATFLIEHQAPGCTSSQAVRSVLDDHARGVFQGKIHVHREGQQTDGYQLCNSMILSEGAEMDTKPELEIYADDVKCSHGATTGQVDEEALFYLRSRGVPRAQARALLIEGFLTEVLEPITHENAQAACLGKVREWLKAAG